MKLFQIQNMQKLLHRVSFETQGNSVSITISSDTWLRYFP